MKTVYDIIIVGAGVAGSAAASAFARQGRNVLLLERKLKEPDRIVGELLQPGGVAALEQLGLSTCLDDIDAVPVRGYHIYWKTEGVTFWYPPFPKHTARPEGRSFHHGKFVSNLRAAAQCENHVKVVETTVTGLLRDKETGAIIGVECMDGEKQSETYHAHLTIIADGSSSNFRSHLRNEKPQARSRFWGLELTKVDLPTYGLAYGVIGRGPPILIYQIGSNETRILIDVPDAVHEKISMEGDIRSYIKHSVIPILPPTVQPRVKCALEDPGCRLRSMPNQWYPPQSSNVPGAFLLGDASNMRHPLTGGGMTVALNDVVLLCELLHPDRVALDDHEAVLRALRAFHQKRKKYSSSLNILAQALYTLFVAADPQLEIMQRGFVRYIQLGGSCVDEPAGLMGGVLRNPFLLLYHFFAVAIYSMWLLFRDSPFWLLPWTTITCLRVFFKAVSIILPFILSEVW